LLEVLLLGERVVGTVEDDQEGEVKTALTMGGTGKSTKYRRESSKVAVGLLSLPYVISFTYVLFPN
jgi:hypothetical protein